MCIYLTECDILAGNIPDKMVSYCEEKRFNYDDFVTSGNYYRIDTFAHYIIKLSSA